MAHIGQDNPSGPMTLHAVMQESVGFGLRERYKPSREIPHGLLVLLMQVNQDNRRAEQAQDQMVGPDPRAARPRVTPKKRP